jgi:hypothetical protein
MNDYDIADEILVSLVADLLGRHVKTVRDEYGPLPRLRSAEFVDAPEHVQLAVLILGGTSWLWGPPGSAVLRDAAHDVRGTDRHFSRLRPSFDKLQRRRGLRYDDHQQRWVVA